LSSYLRFIRHNENKDNYATTGVRKSYWRIKGLYRA
jgi:hypothetical protein